MPGVRHADGNANVSVAEGIELVHRVALIIAPCAAALLLLVLVPRRMTRPTRRRLATAGFIACIGAGLYVLWGPLEAEVAPWRGAALVVNGTTYTLGITEWMAVHVAFADPVVPTSGWARARLQLLPPGLLAALIGTVMYAAFLLWLRSRVIAGFLLRGERCDVCGYRKTRRTSDVCPECGTRDQ
jgi:hypothetical protein